MATLISGQDLGKSFGARSLFAGLCLTVDEGDRIGVIGANGSGKTTLLRILAGEEEPDSGTVHRRRQLRVAYVPQEDQVDPGASVVSLVAAAAAAAAGRDATDGETERRVRVSTVLARMPMCPGDATTMDTRGVADFGEVETPLVRLCAEKP